MSFRNVGGNKYASNINSMRSSLNRTARRQGFLAANRSAGAAPYVFAPPATQAVAPNMSGDTLVLPVPKKKKQTGRVTRKTLLRDVQQLKNKVNKQELKFMGVSYSDSYLNAHTTVIPSRTSGNDCGKFFCHPIQSDATHAPILVQGTDASERIGDKVYYVSARFRIAFSMTQNITSSANFKISPTSITSAGSVTAGTPTTAGWTATLGIPAPIYNPNPSSDGINIPLRIVSLAIREDYLKSCVGAGNSRGKLTLGDIFTYMNDWIGDGSITTTDSTKTYLYSRKVKNEAAGKVRIKEDTIEFVSLSSDTNGVVVLDKNIPIRQEYSFEANKLNGWVHGVLVYLPNIYELMRYAKNGRLVNWTAMTSTDESTPVISWQGSVCYYFYDS